MKIKHNVTPKHESRPRRRRWGKPDGETRRVYVGIMVPQEVGRELASFHDMLAPLPVRFIPPKDMHLTLLPPWAENDLSGAMQKFNDALYAVPSFTLELQKISYGPSPLNPRLVWALCAHTDEILDLKKRLLHEFDKQVDEKVPFVPHITIARFTRESRDANVDIPLDIPLNMRMTVDAVQLIQSPHRGGTGYEELASVHLSTAGIPR